MSDYRYDQEIITQALYDKRDELAELKKEFAAYKRRVKKEKENLLKYQDESLLKAIIPAINNLWHSVVNSQSEYSVYQKNPLHICFVELLKCLKQKNITLIVPRHLDEFSEDTMEAVLTEATQNLNYKGRVYCCIQPGYKILDKIVEFPKVQVYI